MASTKRVLGGLSVKAAGRLASCKHSKKHTVLKGERRLIVKNPGPAGGERGYCVECGLAILAAAEKYLEILTAELTADQ